MMRVTLFVCVSLLLLFVPELAAHGVSARDKAFMEEGGLLAFLMPMHGSVRR